MGMFDTVKFKCPNCGHAIKEQTKVGDLRCRVYPQYEVPVNIAVCLDRDSLVCDHCSTQYYIRRVSDSVLLLFDKAFYSDCKGDDDDE